MTGPGRPKKPASERAGTMKAYRLYPADLERLERLGLATGETATEVIRQALERFEELLEGETT
jgi:predicted DNA-binding protein